MHMCASWRWAPVPPLHRTHVLHGVTHCWALRSAHQACLVCRHCSRMASRHAVVLQVTVAHLAGCGCLHSTCLAYARARQSSTRSQGLHKAQLVGTPLSGGRVLSMVCRAARLPDDMYNEQVLIPAPRARTRLAWAPSGPRQQAAQAACRGGSSLSTSCTRLIWCHMHSTCKQVQAYATPTAAPHSSSSSTPGRGPRRGTPRRHNTHAACGPSDDTVHVLTATDCHTLPMLPDCHTCAAYTTTTCHSPWP
jgi:hypothetical protein